MAQDWLADVRKYAADADEAVVGKIVRYLGIALRNADSSLVSFGDAKEIGRVRSNFLKKKLGLTRSDAELDAGIAAVGERMKGDRTKNRVTVYYLLADYFDALDVFGGAKHGVTGGAARASATAKKPAPAKAAAPATRAPAEKAVATPAAKAPKIPAAKMATPKAAAPKAVAAAKPKAAKPTAPKATAAKATLVSPAVEAATPPPAPAPPPPPPPPAPPAAADAGTSGVLAAASLGDDGASGGKSAGGSGGAPTPPSGGSRWWIWVLAIVVLAAIYFFMQSRPHEPAPKPGWDANLTTDLNAAESATDATGLDNAVDGALTNESAPSPNASAPAQ